MPPTMPPAAEPAPHDRPLRKIQESRSSDLDVVQRRLIDGYAARIWMSDRGWEVADHPGFRIYIDEISTATFRVARIWHTPATMRSRTHPAPLATRVPRPRPGTRLILQVEGRARVDDDALDPGSMIVLPANADVTLGVTEPTARIEVVFSDATHPWISRGFPRTIDPKASDKTSWAVLTSLANALLNAPTAPTTSSFPWLQEAIEHATAALLAEQDASTHESSHVDRKERIAVQADELIRRNAHDPSFTVEELAVRLSVSRRHLTRLLTEQGASPRERLRRARTMVARNLLDGTDPSPWRDEADVARLAGFVSARAMADALSRDANGARE